MGPQGRRLIGLFLAPNWGMRVLVTWGSKLGGTEGIAEIIVERLREAGYDVTARDVRDAPAPTGFDAVVIGGAVYGNHWLGAVRHYVEHHARELRKIPTWLFSAGDAETTREVAALVVEVGAIDHAPFTADRRHPEQVRAWAAQIAHDLPTATPRPAMWLHGHAFYRVLEYGAFGWAALAIAMLALIALTSVPFAVFAHLLLAPMVFGLLARRYQNADGARNALGTAAVWTVMIALLDGILLAKVVRHTIPLVSSIPAYWMPLGLIFAASWAVGAVSAMFPLPKRPAAVQ
jgi:menaquinone-dependent protoporphyrinogen oxidase